MTGRSKSSTSTGASTRKRRALKSVSSQSLLSSVLIQVIKDVAQGTEAERNDVIRWLAKIDDVRAVVEPLGFNAEDMRLRIAELFRMTPALTVHYARRLIEEIKKRPVRTEST